MSTLFESLRSQTTNQHEALHEVVNMQWMTASRQNYRRSLAAYQTAMLAFEPASLRFVENLTLGENLTVDQQVDTLQWPDRLSKLRWLADDIAALDLDDSTEKVTGDRQTMPAIVSASEINDIAVFIGTNYVTEGMTLGARVIEPVIQERLEIDARTGVRFFAGYGDQTGVMWNRFKAWANQQECDVELACQTAAATFDHFRTCLARK